VVVNFSDEPRNCAVGNHKLTLAPRGFYAHARGFTQSRLWENGEPVTRIETAGYHYYQTKSRKQIGPVELEGRVSIFDMGKNHWNILVEGGKDCSIEIRKLLKADEEKRLRLMELDDKGDTVRELAGNLPAGSVRITPAKDIQLYAVISG
jgi:hypothetical protein